MEIHKHLPICLLERFFPKNKMSDEWIEANGLMYLKHRERTVYVQLIAQFLYTSPLETKRWSLERFMALKVTSSLSGLR